MPKFKTHGKWILAGEHSVLRGGHALVFPVRSKFLLFEHIEEDQDFQLNIKNENRDFEMAFWGVLEKALHRVGHKRSDLKGELFLNSNIPVGAGMGASATLCVSLAKWFCSLGWLDEEEQYEFAKGLEDIFHGESSGVDVAVALRNQALEFQRPHSMESFMPIWQPHLYLSFCGKRGVTADCVRQVQKLWQTDEKKARQIDQRMEQAVQMAKQALL